MVNLSPECLGFLEAAIADDGRLTCGHPEIYGERTVYRARRGPGDVVELPFPVGRELVRMNLIGAVPKASGKGTEPASCNRRGLVMSFKYRVTDRGRVAVLRAKQRESV